MESANTLCEDFHLLAKPVFLVAPTRPFYTCVDPKGSTIEDSSVIFIGPFDFVAV